MQATIADMKEEQPMDAQCAVMHESEEKPATECNAVNGAKKTNTRHIIRPDKNGKYPVWMNQREIKKIKRMQKMNNTKQKSKKTRRNRGFSKGI